MLVVNILINAIIIPKVVTAKLTSTSSDLLVPINRPLLTIAPSCPSFPSLSSTFSPAPNSGWFRVNNARRRALQEEHVTSSRLFCWQGKEKVKPRGRDTPFMPMYSRKSAMHWTMWSKSCKEKVGSKGRGPRQGRLPPARPAHR